MLIFLVLFLFIFLYAFFLNNGMFFLALLALIPLALLIVVIHSIIKKTRLLQQFSNIKAGETYEIKLYRPEVKLMLISSPRTYKSSDVLCYGITMIDYQKNKYYYFFGECILLEKEGVKKLQTKLYRELHLQCYANTSIIQVIEDDPHFLKIRARYDYE